MDNDKKDFEKIENSVKRILDANANRAREGLRTAEEYARFVINSKPMSERLKNMRHAFGSAFAEIEKVAGSCLGSRDTKGDVGVDIKTESEGKRADAKEVAAAAVKRMQEALRTLEEYGKTVSGEAASLFEKVRYDSYEMEADLFSLCDRKKRLAESRLYVLVTESLASADALTTAREAAAGGADIIQMREKDMEDGEFLRMAEKMNDICKEHKTLFIINDKPHIAALIDADGIHSGQGDLPVEMSRKLLGRDRIIGMSTHCPEQLAKAFADGADYAGVGPVYETNTKVHRSAVGLEYVRHAAEHSLMPYFCIGSINRDTLDGVLEAGAHAVAVCTGIIAAKDIAAETAWYKKHIEDFGSTKRDS